MNSKVTISLKNKIFTKTKILNILSFIVIWILYGFNTYNSDYKTYEEIYNIIAVTGNYSSRNIEFGYKYIMKFFTMLHFDYQLFLICYSFICLFLLFKAVSKFTDKQYIVFFLFCLYPLHQYILANRLALAMGIVIYAISYLREFNISNVIKYILLILCASLIHSTSFIYILLLIVYLDQKKVLIISLLVTVVLGISLFVPSVVLFIAKFFPKILFYIKDGTNIFTIPVIVIYYIAIICLFMFCKNKTYDDKYKNDYLMFRKIFYAISCSIPMIYFSMDFFRILTNLVVLIYIVMANHKFVVNHLITKKSLDIIFIFILFITIQNYTFGYKNNLESQIIPIISNNLFW